MAVGIQILLNDKLYIRDPQDTKLGRSIVQHGILLIDEIGFEQFTFKKLAERIESTEASIYRYFENKHKLLLYLLCWYWEWMSYLIDFNANNVQDPKERLRIAIQAMVRTTQPNTSISFVDEDVLHRIVIAEGAKGYHTKSVDAENKDGLFATYKALAAKIGAIILELNPSFPYPKALASTLLSMSSDHVYYATHLPRLTDVKVQDGVMTQVEEMLCDFAFGLVLAPSHGHSLAEQNEIVGSSNK